MDWRGQEGIRRAVLLCASDARSVAPCVGHADKNDLQNLPFSPAAVKHGEVARRDCKTKRVSGEIKRGLAFPGAPVRRDPVKALSRPSYGVPAKRRGRTFRHRPVMSCAADQAARDFITFRAVITLRAASLVTNRNEDSLKQRNSHLFNSPSPSQVRWGYSAHKTRISLIWAKEAIPALDP